MNTRERFQAAMNFQPFDRLPLIEWASWWGDTTQRWRGEGMPVEPRDFYGIHDHFGLDRHMQDWVRSLKAVGVQGILPLERQAGVDIARLRTDHPKMRFIGQYDKMVMNKGEAAMRKEFERLVPTAARGGFLISCDHQTPPGVSYADYTLYVKLFREYANEAGRLSRQIPGSTPA